jgi:hypothetical protein
MSVAQTSGAPKAPRRYCLFPLKERDDVAFLLELQATDRNVGRLKANTRPYPFFERAALVTARPLRLLFPQLFDIGSRCVIYAGCTFRVAGGPPDLWRQPWLKAARAPNRRPVTFRRAEGFAYTQLLLLSRCRAPDGPTLQSESFGWSLVRRMFA